MKLYEFKKSLSMNENDSKLYGMWYVKGVLEVSEPNFLNKFNSGLVFYSQDAGEFVEDSTGIIKSDVSNFIHGTTDENFEVNSEPFEVGLGIRKLEVGKKYNVMVYVTGEIELVDEYDYDSIREIVEVGDYYYSQDERTLYISNLDIAICGLIPDNETESIHVLSEYKGD